MNLQNSKMGTSTILYIILMTFSMVHNVYGECTLINATPFERTVECDTDYDKLDDIWDTTYKYNISITNNKIDSYRYSENFLQTIQNLTLNKIYEMPIFISKLPNLIALKITDNLREMNFNIVKSIILQEIDISHNAIVQINNTGDGTNVDSEIRILMSYNFIETIPNNSFVNFPHLKYLDLSHNLINSIDTFAFQGISGLEHLNLSFNKIIEIGHYFIMLKDMKTLLLNNNRLTAINESNFEAMTKLQKLNLSCNELQTIEHSSFQNLEDIEEIDFSNNKLVKITTGLLQNKTKLQKLSFAFNAIQKLECKPFQGSNISHFIIDHVSLIGAIEPYSFDSIETDSLNFSFGRIVTLEPNAFSGLHARALNLSNNIITDISKTSFESIRFLNELDLSKNNLSTIEFETINLKQLLTFNAQNNRISKISKSFLENFESLIKLNLSYNKIIHLEPELFSKLNKLQILDISNNLLANTLMANTFHGLFSVKYIQLNNNKFTSIQNKTFEGFKSLISINCSYGELSSIEYEAFRNTGSLEVLDFSHNLLQEFNVNSTSIDSVKELKLNDNAISNITTKMGKIEKLNLANNKIIKLQSKVFASCKHLKSLDISSNNGIMFEDIFESIPEISELILNNIKKLIVFENITDVSITYLNMSYNDIENINEVFIYKIDSLFSLNLQSNNIGFIDKKSFQSMPELSYLDLSYNLIKFIQPGTFIHTGSLFSLNLHGNSLPALQFGWFDGLYDLRVLNLSSNAIHEFGVNILHNSQYSLEVTTLALDDNFIEHFKFEDFIPTRVRTISIGGNLISCHDLIDIKKRNDIYTITAETLDYHSENVDGIRCTTNFTFNKRLSQLNHSFADEVNLYKNYSTNFTFNNSLSSVNRSFMYENDKKMIVYDYGDIKYVLYFIAVCLVIIIILIVFKIIENKRSIMEKNSFQHSTNMIELQNS